MFHSKRAFANRAALAICPGPVPCIGFGKRPYAAGVEPAILSHFITAQQFKTLAAAWICTVHDPQLGPSKMSAVTFVISISRFLSNLIRVREELFERGSYNPCLFFSIDCYRVVFMFVEFRGDEVFVWELITQFGMRI